MYDPERPYRTKETYKKTTDKKKSDILLTQVMICISLAVVMLVLKLITPAIFGEIKDKYNSLMEDDSVYEAAARAIKPIREEKDKSFEADEPDPEDIPIEAEGLPPMTIQTAIPLTTPMSAELLTAMNHTIPAPDGMSYLPYILNCPITRPLEGEVSSRFGYRADPFTGELDFHKGIDIAAATGEPIVAAFGGIIILTDENDSAGKHILIQHDETLVTAYFHCSKILVREGELVRAGDKIAEVGSTGRSTGPHLHFEIRIDDINFDPAYVL